MRIIKEKIDKELYMDISLSRSEVSSLLIHRVVSKEVNINKKKFTVTVRLDDSTYDNDVYDFYEDF